MATSNAQDTETTDGPKKEHGVLYLGIDLGTSRTSVSASGGLASSR